jgi:hypothetical protein
MCVSLLLISCGMPNKLCGCQRPNRMSMQFWLRGDTRPLDGDAILQRNLRAMCSRHVSPWRHLPERKILSRAQGAGSVNKWCVCDRPGRRRRRCGVSSILRPNHRRWRYPLSSNWHHPVRVLCFYLRYGHVQAGPYCNDERRRLISICHTLPTWPVCRTCCPLLLFCHHMGRDVQKLVFARMCCIHGRVWLNPRQLLARTGTHQGIHRHLQH